MQKALETQREIWRLRGKPLIQTGIGIHAGSMLVGNIGSTERYKYGAIGDNVNLGSRLQSLTKDYGVPIIVSEDTIKKLDRHFHMREWSRHWKPCEHKAGKELSLMDFCDFYCRYAEIPKEYRVDGSGSCRTFIALYCTLKKSLVDKNRRCSEKVPKEEENSR
ncbi:MAG: adenylate/guanylate cyclase domain-containing protein [Vulcanimicrobiota bacterium]